MYNLALMDYDDANHSLSDISNSNNGDMPKVLATVASIIHDFLQKRPFTTVYFEGSTKAKQNLYHRIVKNHYAYLKEFTKFEEISIRFRKNIKKTNNTKDFIYLKSKSMREKLVFTPEFSDQLLQAVKNSQLVKDKVERARIALANDKGMQEIIKKRLEA